MSSRRRCCLGEMLRQTDSGDALKWFIAAGNRGQTEAMVTVGQMLASGRGVHAPDSDRGRDVVFQGGRAGRFGGNVRARRMPSVRKRRRKRSAARGRTFHGRFGVEQSPRDEFFGRPLPKRRPRGDRSEFWRICKAVLPVKRTRLSRRARKPWCALHLRPRRSKNESKAVELFQDGAEKGNPLCMFFYAMCFEGGVGVERDRESGPHLVSSGRPKAATARPLNGAKKTIFRWQVLPKPLITTHLSFVR